VAPAWPNKVGSGKRTSCGPFITKTGFGRESERILARASPKNSVLRKRTNCGPCRGHNSFALSANCFFGDARAAGGSLSRPSFAGRCRSHRSSSFSARAAWDMQGPQLARLLGSPSLADAWATVCSHCWLIVLASCRLQCACFSGPHFFGDLGATIRSLSRPTSLGKCIAQDKRAEDTSELLPLLPQDCGPRKRAKCGPLVSPCL
jgi:hypothetical protein